MRRATVVGGRPRLIATLMLLSLLLGATSTFAVMRPESVGPDRALLVQRATILLERAQARRDQHRAALAEVTGLADRGFAGLGAVTDARRAVDRAEADVRRRELDLTETSRSGRAANDDLIAPLVGGEDFVTRRLIVQRERIALDLEHLRAGERHLEALVAAGNVSTRALREPRAERLRVERELAEVAQRLELRRDFVDGTVTPLEVELRSFRIETGTALAAATDRVEAVRAELEQVRALHAGGLAGSSELRAAEAAMLDAETDLALAEIERRLILDRMEAATPGG